MPPAPGALHGRVAETAALRGALDRVAGGRPTVVAIAGEPGIGKTRLLGLLETAAIEGGLTVLRGAGSEWDRGVPFGAVADALDDDLERLGATALDGLRDEDRARLADLLPALGGAAPAGAGDERHRTLAAFRALLGVLARERPLVLVLDDLHWVDPSAIELVTHLLRRPPRAPVLLALAYRPQPLVQLAGAARAAFIAGGADVLLEPAPLTGAEAAALVAGRVPAARVAGLVVESGGNPFYLEQLAGAPDAAAFAGDLGLAGVPSAVVDSLAGELGRLPERHREVCLAAAVVGDPFEAHLVAAAAGLGELETLEALDALVRAGTIRLSGGPRRFGFRHPILRRAAYCSAPAGALVLAHRRVAERLERVGASPLERAQHVEAAADPGDRAAAELLVAAAGDAARRAPAIAARWYAAALRLLPADGPGAERTRLMVAMAIAEGSAGHLDASRRTLLEVLDTLPDELASLRRRIVPFLAHVDHMSGRHGEATALLRRALGELPDPRAPDAAELGLETATDCLYAPDYPAMLAFAVDAEHAARLSGDRALVAVGAGVLALASYNTADYGAAAASCDRAVALIAPLTDAELAGRLAGLLTIAWTAIGLERFEEAVRVADRGLAISRATGQEHVVVPLTIARIVATTWRGGLAGAAAEADDLVDRARVSHVGQWLAWALTLRGWIAAQAGQLDLAAQCGEEACVIAGEHSGSAYFATHAVLHLAETRLAQGRAGECRAALLEAAGGADLPECERPALPRYYEILTRAALALEELDDAREWARRAGEAAAGSPLGGRRCEALMASAAVLLAEGDGPAAERTALAAAAAARGPGDRLLAARAELLAARACAARDRAAAIAGLEAARAEFEACGATRSRDEAVRELRRLGRRVGGGGPRRQAAEGVAALSRRELEVAELVMAGLTNREIGARLVLSDRTVETHAAAVSRKLDVRGRAAIAATMARMG